MLNTKRIMAIGLLAVGAVFALACSKESTASTAAQQSTSTYDMSVPNTPPATASSAGAAPTTTTSFEVYAKPPREGLPIAPAGGAAQNPLHTSSPVNTHDAKRIGIDEVEALVQSGDAIIVDVRNEEAYEFQHIAGAKHIPLEELASRATQELPPTRWIIPYCT
jgi:hypothetical protein